MFSKHVTAQLSAYCHGELTEAESRRVAEHLRACGRCRKEHEEIQLGVHLARQLPRAQAPAELWGEITAALAPQPSNTHRRPWLAFIFGWPQFAAASALILLLGCGAIWYYLSESPSWEVVSLRGAPQVGGERIPETGSISVGDWLVTDDVSRARISVGQIGHVEVDPNTRLRMDRARDNDHRLTLEVGTMHATIDAPPRYFSVATPSAVAVDLGCAYTLEVDESGAGFLRVTFGWVAFEVEGRESFIPRFAACLTRPGIGPGTPYYEDASAALQAALARLDFEKLSAEEREALLATVLREARKEDAFTLWHLLTRTSGAERVRVYDRLTQLAPPPAGVTREGVLQGDQPMLDRWWDELGLMDTTWWRKWKGPWPPKAK
jgi:hypothetical protein